MLRKILVDNVLEFRKQGKTMREIGKLVGQSRTTVQNIIDSNK
jgi:predicted transcriptional regulator